MEPTSTPSPTHPPAAAAPGRDWQEEAERYRALIAAMDESFCLIDLIPDTGAVQDFRFVETNPAFSANTGLTQVNGRRIRELVPQVPQDWLDLYTQVAATGIAQRTLHHRREQDRWFDVCVFRMGEAGSRRLALLATDVTKRVKAEARLQAQAAELGEADRRKTLFLATLAHELRNPLAPMRNGLQVLRRSGDETTRTHMLDLMDRQMEQLVRLVDDLLDMARVSTGKVTLRRVRMDLREIATHAVDACQPLAAAAGHSLTLLLPAQPLWLDVDPARLGQVLGNLLTNAVKYTPRAGHLSLSARADGDCALIEVRDDGMGIAPELIPQLFRMFVQADSSRQQAPGGLGIGLALVRALVELHGGRVWASSDGPGQGSVFSVSLPLASPPVPSPSQGEAGHAGVPQAQPSGHPGLHVLVVDDNADAAESLALILQMEGHVAQVAHDGGQALEMAERFHPQVVFLDIGMPGMDGYEVARLMRCMPGQTPVLVALTGWSTEEDQARARSAGFDHHLTKPADPADVERLLGTLATSA